MTDIASRGPPMRGASLNRVEIEALAQRAGLVLDPAQLDELAGAAPHIAALAASLKRARPFGDEPAFAAIPGARSPSR